MQFKKYIDIIKVCPVCGEPITIQESDSGVKNVICTNPNCEGQLINRLDHFCGKKGLDIKGLSKATLEKLINWGWLGNIQELFSLDNFRSEWINKPGFGVKSVDNILSAIEESKNCELSAFITALGIPLIGSTYAKTLTRNIPDWNTFRENVINRYDFTKIDGFGIEMLAALYRFDYSEADEIVKHILNLTNSNWKNQKEDNNTLKDITVVITGKLLIYKNRAALQSVIENVGGKVASSVSKKTNYLINNDNTSTSAKNLSAQKLGIPILTEEEFIKNFLKNA